MAVCDQIDGTRDQQNRQLELAEFCAGSAHANGSDRKERL